MSSFRVMLVALSQDLTLLNLPDHKGRGFLPSLTYKEAQEYIESMCCAECQEEVKLGFYDIDLGDDSEDRIGIDNILQTMCGSQWLIVSDEEFEKAESMWDLFNAAEVMEKNNGD